LVEILAAGSTALRICACGGGLNRRPILAPEMGQSDISGSAAKRSVGAAGVVAVRVSGTS